MKIGTIGEEKWFVKELIFALDISQSEISESLNCAPIAGLLSADKKKLMQNNLLDFLEYGLRYVHPAEPGAIQRGIPTAHNAPPLNNIISAEESYVWPWAEGEARGQAIEPLHPGVSGACVKDPALYELLTLTDALRLGRIREKHQAIEELRKRIL